MDQSGNGFPHEPPKKHENDAREETHDCDNDEHGEYSVGCDCGSEQRGQKRCGHGEYANPEVEKHGLPRALLKDRGRNKFPILLVLLDAP